MKNLRILLLIILVPFFCIGQTEKEKSKKVSAEFEKLYNSDKFQSIFELFSEEMKSALLLKKLMNS